MTMTKVAPVQRMAGVEGYSKSPHNTGVAKRSDQFTHAPISRKQKSVGGGGSTTSQVTSAEKDEADSSVPTTMNNHFGEDMFVSDEEHMLKNEEKQNGGGATNLSGEDNINHINNDSAAAGETVNLKDGEHKAAAAPRATRDQTPKAVDNVSDNSIDAAGGDGSHLDRDMHMAIMPNEHHAQEAELNMAQPEMIDSMLEIEKTYDELMNNDMMDSPYSVHDESSVAAGISKGGEDILIDELLDPSMAGDTTEYDQLDELDRFMDGVGVGVDGMDDEDANFALESLICTQCEEHEQRIISLETALHEISTQHVNLFNEHNLLKQLVLQTISKSQGSNSSGSGIAHRPGSVGAPLQSSSSAQHLMRSNQPQTFTSSSSKYGPAPSRPHPAALRMSQLSPADASIVEERYRLISAWGANAQQHAGYGGASASSTKDASDRGDGAAPDYAVVERYLLDILATKAKYHIKIGIKGLAVGAGAKLVMDCEAGDLRKFQHTIGARDDEHWVGLRDFIERKLLSRIKRMNMQVYKAAAAAASGESNDQMHSMRSSTPEVNYALIDQPPAKKSRSASHTGSSLQPVPDNQPPQQQPYHAAHLQHHSQQQQHQQVGTHAGNSLSGSNNRGAGVLPHPTHQTAVQRQLSAMPTNQMQNRTASAVQHQQYYENNGSARPSSLQGVSGAAAAQRMSNPLRPAQYFHQQHGSTSSRSHAQHYSSRPTTQTSIGSGAPRPHMSNTNVSTNRAISGPVAQPLPGKLLPVQQESNNADDNSNSKRNNEDVVMSDAQPASISVNTSSTVSQPQRSAENLLQNHLSNRSNASIDGSQASNTATLMTTTQGSALPKK